MEFRITATEGSARLGSIRTAHGTFETPAFMPVGTSGSVKAIEQRELTGLGAEILLGNTYHLYLRPGTGILEAAGGLHRFMGWDGSILTDSGGFQVFSLSGLRTITEEGVKFRSHLDGSGHLFTPEKVVDIQRSIGSDIMMVLDECVESPCDREYVASSNARTLRWAERALRQFHASAPLYGYPQAIFGIIQGGTYPDIREYSATVLRDMEFDGYAVGGLAVGEPASEMYDMIGISTAIMPAQKPRYLMGVGTPENLLEAIARGIDMFDCVLPTRNGRNAMLFTSAGTMTITNAKYKNDFTPVDPDCCCYTCSSFTRAYLRHLFQAREILALQLSTIHNLAFYQTLMRSARQAIRSGSFSGWKRETLARMKPLQPQIA